MGWTGIWQWVVVLVIVLILFGGRGKVSALMGDFGKGLKAFKKSMKEEEAPDQVESPTEPKTINAEPAQVIEPSTETDDATKN